MLRPPCLLRLDGLGLEAWQLHGRTPARVAAFGADAVRDFVAWLRQQPSARRYRLLCEFGDEAFEAEDLPRVRGADRRALLARKLATYFPDPALARAEALGRDSATATGLERVLFTGLSRPALLAPWLEALRIAGARLERLVSAAQLIGHFAPRAARPGADALLAGFTRAGMRLSHFEQARLQFARLVPGCTAEAAGHDPHWLAELERTRQYIAGQRGADIVPAVVVLAGAEALALPAADTAAGSMPAADLRFVTAASLGMPAPAGTTAGPDLTPLLLHWLARAPQRLGWTAATSAAAPRHLPHALLGGGALVFSACALAAALRWSDSVTLENDRALLHRRHLAARQALAALESARPALPLAPQVLIDTLARLDHAQPARLAPLALFRHIATALASQPEASLQRLHWNVAPQGELRVGLSVDLGVEPGHADGSAGNARLETIIRALEAGGAREVRRTGTGRAPVELTLSLPTPPAGRPTP